MHSLFVLALSLFSLVSLSPDSATVGFTVNEPDLRYLCSAHNSSLCVGVSFQSGEFPTLEGRPLQLKNRYNLLFRKEYEDAQKHIAWAWSNKTFLKPFFDSRVGVVMVRDGTQKDIVLGTRPSRVWVNYTNTNNRTFVAYLPDNDCCLTIMRCSPNALGFCDADETKAVVLPGQIRQGCHISCKPCSGTNVTRLSQRFTANHDCSPECHDWMIGNGKCDTACFNTPCFNDGHDCDNSTTVSPTRSHGQTEGPTRSPSKAPTMYIAPETWAPSRGPTHGPTRGPTRDPTHSPTHSSTSARPTTARPTTLGPTPQTHQPTRTPTRLPTQHPSRNPTQKPTKKPTRHPTGSPTWYPSTEPIVAPTRRPTKNPSRHPSLSPTKGYIVTLRPASAPTLSPKHDESRASTHNTTLSPTQPPSYSVSVLIEALTLSRKTLESYSIAILVFVVFLFVMAVLAFCVTACALCVEPVQPDNRGNTQGPIGAAVDKMFRLACPCCYGNGT